jgi:hypothetical protein
MLSAGSGDTGKRGSMTSYINPGLQYKRPYAAGVVNISKIITKRSESSFCNTSSPLGVNFETYV